MKILKLTVENVKRIVAVEVRPNPDGSLVIVGGRNAQGKSSLLDSIMYALAGKGSIPENVLREGQKKGEIVVELDVPRLTIKRTFTPKGGALSVYDENGAPLSSPQAFLDRLIGSGLAFDPLAFSRMKPREQVEAIKAALNLDFSDLDADRRTFFEQRTMANRDVKVLGGTLGLMPFHADAPAEEVSAQEIIKKMNAANELGFRIDGLRDRRDGLRLSVEEQKARIELLKAEIARLTEAVVTNEAAVEKANAEGKALVEQARAVDVEGLKAQLNAVDETNKKVRENAARANTQTRYDAAADEAKRLDEEVKAIDETKAELVAEAKLPLPEMGLTDEGITFRGLPLSANASSAEQLRVCLATAMCLNKDAPLAIIREGSLLDGDNLKLIEEVAADYDGQVWLERVGQHGDETVVIEGGKVQG